MDQRFAGVTVLVTGASGQIGSACAAAYAAEGANVVAVDRDATALEGDTILAVQADLADPSCIPGIFDAAQERFGTVTVVAQCAAGHGRTRLLDTTPEVIDRVLDVNVKATLLVGKVAAERMIAAGVGGVIVNFTSISGIISHAESVIYEASKGAVTMATKAMANALAPHGIRVVAVGPGVMVKAQEVDEVRAPDALTDFERRRIPLQRFGVAAEIAAAALFLSSDAASYITGTVLYADGGAMSVWSTAEPT